MTLRTLGTNVAATNAAILAAVRPVVPLVDTAATAAANTTAILNALATGRPVQIPGDRSTVYNVNELSSGFTTGSVMYGEATLRLSTGVNILNKTGISGFRLDKLTFDANDLDVNAVPVRLIDCTDFDLGSTRYIKGGIAGLDLQECTDFRAGTLTADDNGLPSSAVGAGVYVRNKTGGTGCKRFTIEAVVGSLNGLGSGLDGSTFQTFGSATTGQVGRITARNNTRYGVKLQHSGGMVQIGSIHTSGNVRNVSFPSCVGVQFGSIYSEDASDIGVWFDAGCQNIQGDLVSAIRSGNQGVRVEAGAVDVQVDTVYSELSGTSGAGNGRGLDIRGITRGKFSKVTLIDAGGGDPNPTLEALYVAPGVTDLQFGTITLLDRRALTARCLRPANFSGVTVPNVTIGSFMGSGFQSYDIFGIALVRTPSLVSEGKYLSRQQSATILSGATSVTITHGLGWTPTRVLVTGTSADTGAAYAANIGGTTFQVVVPSAVGADRTVYWSAGLVQ